MRLTGISLSLLAVALLGACSGHPQADGTDVRTVPKNVIFLLGDGMGAAQIKAYRAYVDDPAVSGIPRLAFESHLVGAVATDSITAQCDDGGEPPGCRPAPYGVTDSASSATAYATGIDTVNGAVGVDPAGKALVTVVERAAADGMATGLVATSQITHASPAAFATHVPSRSMYHAIADQLYDNQVAGRPVVDVLLGGGLRDLRRSDRDLVGEFVDAGYAYVRNLDELRDASADRLLGLFAPVGMPRHWDLPDGVPTLADMTRKALATLSRDPDGFFLMVEGSQIDWAGHGNDIVGTVSEMEGFVEAIDVALAFAAERGDTLVVVTADHETGGLSLARDGIYAWDPTALRGLRGTPAEIVRAAVADGRPLAAVTADFVPFELTEEEIAALDADHGSPEAAYRAVNRMFDERTFTGWTTLGHTGVDVPLYAFGPGHEAFRGLLQNETVGRALLAAIGH